MLENAFNIIKRGNVLSQGCIFSGHLLLQIKSDYCDLLKANSVDLDIFYLVYKIGYLFLVPFLWLSQ